VQTVRVDNRADGRDKHSKGDGTPRRKHGNNQQEEVDLEVNKSALTPSKPNPLVETMLGK
jgi:hypothetical protein